MPGVAARTPGGLTYTQAIDLIAASASGPGSQGSTSSNLSSRPHWGLSALTAARLLANVIGTIVRQA